MKQCIHIQIVMRFEKEQSYFDSAQIRIKKAQEQTKTSMWFG